MFVLSIAIYSLVYIGDMDKWRNDAFICLKMCARTIIIPGEIPWEKWILVSFQNTIFSQENVSEDMICTLWAIFLCLYVIIINIRTYLSKLQTNDVYQLYRMYK